MELMGICSVCGKGGARHTCRLCGRLVCDMCYDSAHGICVVCKRSKTI